MKAAAAALLALAACHPGTIDVKVVSDAQLPAQMPAGYLGLGAGLSDFGNAFGQSLQGAGSDSAHVDQAHATEAHLTATDDGDLSFLSEVELTLSAAGLPDVKLASQTVFPALQGTVALTVDSATDLAPYLKASQVTVKSKLGYDHAPGHTRQVEATLTLSVKLKL